MRKFVLCAMYYVLCLLVAGSVHAKNLIPELAASGLPYWNPPAVIQKTLANGFSLYLLPDPTLPLFEAKLYLKTGGAYVPAGQAGLAELMASTWTSGGTKTKTPQEMDQWLEDNAIHVTSDSGRELTTLTLSCLAFQKEEALNFFQELLFQPGFDTERFQLAKRRFQEGLRRLKDHPNELLSQTFRESLYGPKHPFGSHPNLKTLGRIQRDDLLNFYRRSFHPQQMLVAVAGDFSPKEMSAWAEKYFGSLPQNKNPEPNWPELPFETKAETKRVKKKLTQSFIEVGHLSLQRHAKEKYAYGLLQYILGGDPFTSRLGRDLRAASGLAYSVYSHWDSNPTRGMFKIHIETKQESEALVLEKIKEHLRKIQTGDVSAEELARAKEALLNQYIFWFDSTFDIVEQQASLNLLGYEGDYLSRYPERLKKVTLEEVNAVAKKYIQPDQLKIVVVGP